MRKPSSSPSSQPLQNARHERFAIAVAGGSTLVDAYEIAGFKRNKVSAWKLRKQPEVNGRIQAILKARVDEGTRQFAKHKLQRGDTLTKVVKRLESIALIDPGELLNWERVPILNADGEVTGYETALQVKDSAKLTADQRAAVRGVFTKSGQLRVELHDQVNALVNLHKLLTGKDGSIAPSITINQQNIGDVPALDAARKVAFLLAAARSQGEPAKVIEAVPVVVDAKDSS